VAAPHASAERQKLQRNLELSLVRKSVRNERIRAKGAMTVTGRSSIRKGQAGSEIMPTMNATHWNALYTRHHHEKGIAQALSNKGINVFLPLYGAVHLWRNRPQKLQLPLFPCYVFVQDALDRRDQIVGTPGIHSILTFGGVPAIVPPGQIAALRRVVEDPAQARPHEYLQTGDRVMVISGSLQGVEGILVRTKGSYRLVVSVEMLGRSAAVEIDVTCVRRIGQPLMVPRPRSLSATA
jgi:transcription antitermination factor NusG